MPTYRITLELKSPLGTDLVSGTIWGHLAWAVRYLEGDSGLGEWLEDQEKRPWLLSSQLPVGMLPRPLLKPTLNRDIPASIKEMGLEKAARKIAFIPEALFVKLRTKMTDAAITQALKAGLRENGSPIASESHGVKAHNRIDRLTGTTPESGGLFFEEVLFPSRNTRRQLFLSAPEPCLDRLESLFAFIGENGFGSNASTGNGHFEFSIAEERSLFEYEGTRAMSLSHGVISANMKQARFKQHVHFGKLGGDFARGRYSPFKHPILMARPGATFTAEHPGPFGRILRGVHHDPALAALRHHALHLPIAFREVES